MTYHRDKFTKLVQCLVVVIRRERTLTGEGRKDLKTIDRRKKQTKKVKRGECNQFGVKGRAKIIFVLEYTVNWD